MHRHLHAAGWLLVLAMAGCSSTAGPYPTALADAGQDGAADGVLFQVDAAVAGGDVFGADVLGADVLGADVLGADVLEADVLESDVTAADAAGTDDDIDSHSTGSDGDDDGAGDTAFADGADPEYDCDAGPCCDLPEGSYAAKGSKCGVDKEETFWGCAGATLQKRFAYAGCSGSSASCSTSSKHHVLSDWVEHTVCKKGTVCVQDPPGCVAKTISPESLNPCKVGQCWSAPSLGGFCGAETVNEDYSSGKYNVHQYALSPKPNVDVELSLQTTAGGMKPALVIRDGTGVTVYDGLTGGTTAALKVSPIASGKNGKPAKVGLNAAKAMKLQIYITGWSVIDGGFAPKLSKSVKYALKVSSDCTPTQPGELLSPPCFDPKNVNKGFHLLPKSCPPGLYTRKADDCARGTKLLIDVLYTVAWWSKKQAPAYSPLKFLDLNKGSCSTVKHATHGDGTHVDVVAGCATSVACKDTKPAINLAKLFVDTGKVCGIIFNDVVVQKQINAYFKSKYTYKPWFGTFMRSVSGHNSHFHVRVKKPDGKCN